MALRPLEPAAADLPTMRHHTTSLLPRRPPWSPNARWCSQLPSHRKAPRSVAVGSSASGNGCRCTPVPSVGRVAHIRHRAQATSSAPPWPTRCNDRERTHHDHWRRCTDNGQHRNASPLHMVGALGLRTPPRGL